MTRYVIAEVTMYDHLHKLLVLPDAEHVHVTIANGTITAVPMRRVGVVTDYDPFPYSWVDALGETP